MKALDPAGLDNILVVKLSSLGDIVHGTPCLRALRGGLPQGANYYGVERRFAPVVRHNPHLDELIEVDHAVHGWLPRARQVRAALAPRPRFDLALDLQGRLRSAAWVYLSGARLRAGRGGFRSGWHCVVRPDLSKHAVLVCAEVVRALSVPVRNLAPEVFLSPQADAELAPILQFAGLPPDGFVLVNPFSRWRSKDWPPERYAALLGRLAADGIGPLVLSGGPDRRAEAAHLMALVRSGTAVSLAGKLSLEQAMCLYGRARLMVTGDSGPMHIAAALGVPVVALFGPTLPERTGPWGAGHAVIQKMRPARHHAYQEDPGRLHVSAIDVETVHAAIRAAYDRPAPTPSVGHFVNS